MTWYEITFIVCISITFAQTVLMLLGLDLDFDFDVNSDLISFKGLLHFLVGSTGTLCIFDSVTIISILTATIVGVFLVVLLNWIYKSLSRVLTQEIEYEMDIPEQLVEIYLWNGSYGVCNITLEGAQKQVPIVSDASLDLKCGDYVYAKGNRHLLKITN